MDLQKIAQFYISHVLKTSQGPSSSSNISVLLLDAYTTSILSIVSSQSELLSSNIFLIDKLENSSRDKLRHLNCIVFISPSPASLNFLCDELKFPKYKKYNVFMSNFLTKSQLEKIAESDDLELVEHIQELFWDYLVYNSVVFETCSAQGRSLTSLLLSLKAKPVVRYETNTARALRVANDVFFEMSNPSSNSHTLFSGFPKSEHRPLLVVLDRKNDPLTPLLTPWTYQSMIHEYFNIDKNVVDMSDFLVGEKDELTKIILSADQDKFFGEAMYLNFADLSDKISLLVNNYKSKTNNTSSLNSLDDMKNFLSEYPEFRKLSHNVNKHITITSELSKKVTSFDLWQVSEVEQQMSLGKETDFSHHSRDFESVKTLITGGSLNPEKPTTQVPNSNKLKLVLIYALRYCSYKQNQLRQLKSLLQSHAAAAQESLDLVDFFVKQYSSKKRLYNTDSTETQDSGLNFSSGNSNLSILTPEKGANFISSLKKLGVSSNNKNGLEDSFDYDEDNTSIFMQHKPRLLYILQNILNKKLSGDSFPVIDANSLGSEASLGHVSKNNNTIRNEAFQEIIIYFVDGVTYEETRLVALLNERYKSFGIKLVIGSDRILNSASFIQQTMAAMKNSERENGGRGLGGRNQREERLLGVLGD